MRLAKTLDVGRDHLVAVRRDRWERRSPRRGPHHFLERPRERLLNGIHDVRFDRVDICAKCRTKSSWEAGETLFIDAQMRQRRSRLTLREQRANRFAGIEAEARDVHQSDDIPGIRSQRSHDLTAVGMSGKKARARQRRQHLPKPCDIGLECRQRKLRRRHVVPRFLQEPDDAAPTGTVTQAPCTKTMFGCSLIRSYLPCRGGHAHAGRLPDPHDTDCPIRPGVRAARVTTASPAVDRQEVRVRSSLFRTLPEGFLGSAATSATCFGTL